MQETSRERRAKGRPRDSSADRAIVSATLDELQRVGYHEMSVGGVARAAGVSRPTLYRRYPDKSALVTAACSAIAAQVVSHPHTGALHTDVDTLLRGLAHAFFETRARAVVPALLAAIDGHPELAQAARVVWEPRREVLTAVLADAVERGELPAGTDLDGAVDLLYGPLYYRLLVTRSPLEPEVALRLARHVLAGLGSSGDPRIQDDV